MITEEEKVKAEEQILEQKEPISYDTREYPVEVLIDKFQKGEFYIPNYQREFVWEKDIEKMSKFIESVILDLPIPYLFFADNDSEAAKLEIIDGSQRIRTLESFKSNKFTLEGLDVLDLLNGFRFDDLPISRQRRFLRKTLRSIELTERASDDVKRDLFARINIKPYDLLPMEIRKGIYQGRFYDFMKICTENSIFSSVCPISNERNKRGESQELVLRYFAFADKYKSFEHSVEDFLDDYMKDMHENGFELDVLENQFNLMLVFVQQNFRLGFRKSQKSNSVPRVRFEAIAVGVTLALRENPAIQSIDVNKWINSIEFKNHTTSGSANNKLKVISRIEYVKNAILS